MRTEMSRVLVFRFRCWPIAAVLAHALSGHVRADGLIFQLPPDGTWARYAVATEGEFEVGDATPKKISFVGTLSVASVGTVQRAEQECRWIELKWETDDEGPYQKLVLKMLIPTDRLQRGEDPFAHAVLTFFNPKPGGDKDGIQSYITEGFNRIQYEIDRFRDVFPKPFESATPSRRETIDTAAGEFANCQILQGPSSYDGPLLNGGRMVYKADYRVAVHPDAPFGVVMLHVEAQVREISGGGRAVPGKMKKTLTLTATGENATSDLPERPEQDE